MLLCCAACAALSAGCSKETADNGVPMPDKAYPVVLSASVDNASASAVALSSFTGSIDGSKFPAMSPAFTTDVYAGNSSSFTREPAYFTVDANTDAAGNVSWADGKMRYFPLGADNRLWFFAWSPAHAIDVAGTSTSNPMVNFSIDGNQDIMWASTTSDPTADAVPIKFEHKLMKVSFRVKCDEYYHLDDYFTGVEIADQPTIATLRTYSGDLSFGAQTSTYELFIVPDDPITTTTSDVLLSVMLKPQTSFIMYVWTQNHSYNRVPVSINEADAVAGNEIVVTLTFKEGTVSVSYTTSTWKEYSNTIQIG